MARPAWAGWIKYVLKEPSTDKLGRAELGATAASHGDTGYSLRGLVNIPVSDWLAVSGSGFKREDAPYLDNSARTAKKDTNTRDVWARARRRWFKLDDGIRLVSALHQKTDAINSDPGLWRAKCASARPASPTTPRPPRSGSGRWRFNDQLARSRSTRAFKLYTARADLDLGNAAITLIKRLEPHGQRHHQRRERGVRRPASRSPWPATWPNVVIANADKTHKFSQELASRLYAGVQLACRRVLYHRTCLDRPGP